MCSPSRCSWQASASSTGPRTSPIATRACRCSCASKAPSRPQPGQPGAVQRSCRRFGHQPADRPEQSAGRDRNHADRPCDAGHHLDHRHDRLPGPTGIGFIGLTGGNVNDRNIIQSALEQGATPVITANPSDVTDILATARDIADRANNILGEFEQIVQAIGPAVRTTADNVAQTSTNVRTFTDSLAANADQIERLPCKPRRPLAQRQQRRRSAPRPHEPCEHLHRRPRRRGREPVDPERRGYLSIAARPRPATSRGRSSPWSSAVAGFGSVGDTITQNLPSVQTFLQRLGPISETATSVATRLDSTLADVSQITAAVNPDQVRSTINKRVRLHRRIERPVRPRRLRRRRRRHDAADAETVR